MCGAGGSRVLNALSSCSARMGSSGYISVLPALIHEREIEKAYRVYVTDCLRMITENTAPSAAYYSSGKMGQYPQMRFAELFDPKPVETRTEEDVISNVIKKLEELK